MTKYAVHARIALKVKVCNMSQTVWVFGALPAVVNSCFVGRVAVSGLTSHLRVHRLIRLAGQPS